MCSPIKVKGSFPRQHKNARLYFKILSSSKCIEALKIELKQLQAHHLLNILEQDDKSNENQISNAYTNENKSNENHDANGNHNDNAEEKNHITHSKIISNNNYLTTETTKASTRKNGRRALDNTEPSKMTLIMRGLFCGIFTSLFILATAILINYSMM